MKGIVFILLSMLHIGALWAQTDTIRVLAIGNSFSQDAVEQYLYELGREVGVELIIGNGYRAGQGFASHWRDVTEKNNTFEYRKVVRGVRTNKPHSALRTLVEDEPWDYITVQQASPESGLYGTFEPCISELLSYASALCSNPDVQMGYHMTWSYAMDSTHGGYANYGSNQQTMYDSICQSVQQALAIHPEMVLMVPSGTAIQNARQSWLGDNLNRDGYHLDLLFGRYTAACTWLERLTGVSSVGLSYRPEGIDSLTALTCQMAAHRACATPFHVADMSDVGFPPVNVIEPGLIKFNFGNEPCGMNDWNDIATHRRTYTWITDEHQHPTGITLTATHPMSGANQLGATYTLTRMLMPACVSMSALWGYSQGKFGASQARPMAEFVLGHLNPRLKYDFTIYASRSGGAYSRQTTFVVQGEESEAESLQATDNDHDVVRFRDVCPTADGRILLQVMPGPHNNSHHHFYYLNAMVIRAH